MRVALVSIVFSAAAAITPVAAQAVAQSYQLDIARQPLDVALQELARQTGLQIARFGESPDGSALVGPVAGDMSVEQALRTMLVPSGLVYKVVNDHTIAVTNTSAVHHPSQKEKAAAPMPDDSTKAGRSFWDRFRVAQVDSSSAGNQGAVRTTDASLERTPDVAHADQLQEVIVTATKTAATDVAKVPISISAYSQQDLDAQGVKSIAEIAAMTPGVNFSQQNQNGGAPQTNIEIRGIQSRTGAPTTAIYLDDTPLIVRSNQINGGATLPYPEAFDLQRVEVLRGPQGTLFGASAEGGAIRFITTPPSLTSYNTYARTEVSGTRYGGASYEGGVATGGPIVQDQLGFRASAWFREDGGYIDRCEPKVREAGCQSTLDTNVNRVQSYVLNFATTWAPSDALRITPQLYYQRIHYFDGGSYELADSNPDHGQFVFGLASSLPATDPLFVPSLKIEASLPGDVTMTSVTSYVWRDFAFQLDYTQYQDFAFFGNPYPLTGAADDFARGFYNTHLNNLYEELRFASGGPNTRLSWVAGVYAEHARQFDHAQVEHPDLPALIQTIYGKSIEAALGVGPYLDKWVYWADQRETDKQIAIFANTDWKFTHTLRLNLGARWAKFDTDSSLFLAGPFNGGSQQFAGGASSNSFTPKAGLTWQPDELSTYYVSAGKGYRAGGVNTQVTSEIPGCNVVAPHTIQPDSLWSYEIGSKNRLFDRRLAIDTSVYYIDWKNIQNFTQVPQCAIGVVFNLGRVVSKGFDVSLQALLTHNLKLGLQAGYTNAYFKDTTVLPRVGQIVTAGDAVAGASNTSGAAVPPWSVGLSGEYDFRAFSRDAYFSLQDIFHSRNNGPFQTKDPRNTLNYDPALPTDPSTNLLNMRLGLRFDHVDAMLFANNVLNAHPQLATNHALPGDMRLEAGTFRPFTIGVSASFRY